MLLLTRECFLILFFLVLACAAILNFLQRHFCYLNHFPIALSHWCIFHRGKAELVVATWDKQFHNSEMVQKVPLLYLANDILQNSKRKGNEFVTEFWKVLPAALKDVLENGDNHGKNVISRLVSSFLSSSWICGLDLAYYKTKRIELADFLSMNMVQKVLPGSYFMHFFLPLNM